MTFQLTNNLVSEKMREEMYLKHLRQVERINNREADSLKKNLKEYHSIAELHHQNKAHSFRWKVGEHQRSLEAKNAQINRKIELISCDKDMKSSRYHASTVQPH